MNVNCLRHDKPAKQYRLKYPQPDSTPNAMRWEQPGPPLWMCPKCADGTGDWAEVANG